MPSVNGFCATDGTDGKNSSINKVIIDDLIMHDAKEGILF